MGEKDAFSQVGEDPHDHINTLLLLLEVGSNR